MCTRVCVRVLQPPLSLMLRHHYHRDRPFHYQCLGSKEEATIERIRQGDVTKIDSV